MGIHEREYFNSMMHNITDSQAILEGILDIMHAMEGDMRWNTMGYYTFEALMRDLHTRMKYAADSAEHVAGIVRKLDARVKDLEAEIAGCASAEWPAAQLDTREDWDA